MQVRAGQDFAAGLLFALVGLAALWISADYQMGTAQRPGTGVLPQILSWCLIVTGSILVLKALLSGDEPIGRWAVRPLVAVTTGIVAFAFLVDELGLIVAMVVSLTLCALGTPETRWSEYLFFLLFMLLLGTGLFVVLLGMPIPIWPVKAPGWFAFILR